MNLLSSFKGFLQWWAWQFFLYFLGMIIIVAILFAMGNQLNQVETWIYWHKWEFLLGIKAFTFLFLLGFQGVRDLSFRFNESSILSALFALSSLSVMLYLSGGVIRSDQLQSLEGMVNIMAKMIWYASDILILKELIIRPNKKALFIFQVLLALFFSLLSWWGHSLFFVLDLNLDFYYFFNLFLALVFMIFWDIRRVDLLFLIIFVFIPSKFFSSSFTEPYGRWVEFYSYIDFVEYALVIGILLSLYALCQKFLLRASAKW